MNLFIRLREIFKPSAKCARVGHKFWHEYRVGYTRPEHFGITRFVCDEVEQERPVCIRCGANDPANPDWVTVSRKGISGYSWPSAMAREFKDNGEIWTESGRRFAAKAKPDP